MPSIKDIIIKKPTEQEKQTCCTWPTWEHESAVFEWEYTQKETCLIIEGEVSVSDISEKESVSFSAGDLVIFPDNLSCIWEIKKAVKKHYNFE